MQTAQILPALVVLGFFFLLALGEKSSLLVSHITYRQTKMLENQDGQAGGVDTRVCPNAFDLKFKVRGQVF